MKKVLIPVIFLVTVIAVCFCMLVVVYPLKYKKQILNGANKYGLQVGLVSSVICVESRFNPNAKSSSGACGLMQLMPSTYNWIIVNQKDIGENIFDVNNNIMAGCYYLRYLIEKYSQLVYVLACYNAGESVVSNWGTPQTLKISDIKYKETQTYVKKVLGLIRLYNSRFT